MIHCHLREMIYQAIRISKRACLKHINSKINAINFLFGGECFSVFNRIICEKRIMMQGEAAIYLILRTQ